MPKLDDKGTQRLLGRLFSKIELNYSEVNFNAEHIAELRKLITDLLRGQTNKENHGPVRSRADQIIIMNFAMDSGVFYSLDEIAVKISNDLERKPPYTRENVRRINNLGIRLLRRHSSKVLIMQLVRKAVTDERKVAMQKLKST